VTLSGGARHLEVQAECGHVFAGEDFPGAVSFVPAGCTRRLQMQDVRARWASISLAPDLLDDSLGPRALDLPTLTNMRDPFASSLLGELTRESDEGQLDEAYCDALALALGHHLARRYGSARERESLKPRRLPAWRLRKIADYVEAHLDRPISVRDLAEQAQMSVGHFHRTLRATTGQSPLGYIQARRIERARRRLLEGAPIAAVSCEIGFASPSHFARTFRRWTGRSPAEFRHGVRKRGSVR
jgi:AraC family transcriptional regulator